MAYVPGFQYDVFVSYARRSDLFEWVTKFKDDLQSQLVSTLGGREAVVWMDLQLRIGDDFQQRIQAKLRQTALFVAVVSPRYLESEPCMLMELQFFRDNGTGEILQIVKTPLEPGQSMPFPNFHYRDFFERQDWGPDEFEPGEARFSKLVKQVAVQVRSRLLDMRRTRQKVYLTHLDPQTADPTLRRHREALLNEFEDRGYETLPRQISLNRTVDDLTRQAVEESDALVYLYNGAVEAAQFQLARQLRKPTVVCTLQPLPSLEAEAEIPVIFGVPDWKVEVVRRVEAKLSQRLPGAS